MGEAHQGLFYIRQHIATQMHKTNLEITHSRESEIPLAIETLQREIDEHFLRQFVSRKKSVVCCICNTEILLSHKATLNNVSSTNHQQKVKKFGKVATNNISLFFTKKGESVENSGWSRSGKQLCLGYYKETTVYKLDNQSVIKKPRLLLDDLKPGVDPELHVIVHQPDEAGYVEIKGTLRSADCLQSGDSGAFKDEMCAACTNILKLKSFKKRLLWRSTISLLKKWSKNWMTRSKSLTWRTLKSFLSAKNISLRIRARTIREKLAEFARRGSMKAVCYNLQKAPANGLLEDRNILKGLLEMVSKNFHVEKNDKRYQAPFKLFLEVLLFWGGPRIANFVTINLGGPEIHSIYRWHNQHRTELDGESRKLTLSSWGCFTSHSRSVSRSVRPLYFGLLISCNHIGLKWGSRVCFYFLGWK